MNSNLIVRQANALWCTLRDPDTGGTFLEAIFRIWKLLIQIVLLVFLLVLLVFAAIILLWGVAFQKGCDDRQWLHQKQPVENNEFVLHVIGGNLLAVFKGLVDLSRLIIQKILGIYKPASQPAPTAQKALPSPTLLGVVIKALTATEAEP